MKNEKDVPFRSFQKQVGKTMETTAETFLSAGKCDTIISFRMMRSASGGNVGNRGAKHDV